MPNGKWENSYIEDGNADYYKISYELMNHFDKGIQRMYAYVTFKDLNGELLYSIQVTPNLVIASKGKVKASGMYRLHRYIKNHFRIICNFYG